MRIIRNLFLYLSVLLGVSGCTDELSNLSVVQSEMTGISVDSIFNGNCNTYALSSNLGLEGEISTEGDFFTLEKETENWNLYLEENNDGNSRIGKITAIQNDGTQQTFTFLQHSRSTKEFELNKRSYGLGYSYDGYGGEKCDPNSVLCQVINLAEVKKLQDKNSIQLMSTDFNKSVLSTKLNSAYSWAEFVHNANISGGVKANVIIYKGEYVEAMSLLEYQRENYIFICNEQHVEKAKLELFSSNLKKSIQENPQVLTHSFRKALAHLKENPNNLSRIDSFLVRYGSHVVTSSTLGGSLKLYNSISRKSFTDIFEKKHFENHQIPLLFKQMKESSEEYNYENAMNNSSLSLKVRGGKLTSMNDALFNPSFSNPNITENALIEWLASIKFSAEDVNDPDKNNAEMIDMEIVPIWEFISDSDTKNAVKARAIGTAFTLADMFGTASYPNLEIIFDQETPTDYVYNKIDGNIVGFDYIYTLFVVYEGKIAAVICREYLPVDKDKYGIGSSFIEGSPLWAIYPVNNGRVDLTAGYLISTGKLNTTYNISWAFNTLEITPKEVKDFGIGITRCYLTNGTLGATPVEGVDYEKAKYIYGIAFPYSVAVDGDILGCPYYPIKKFLGHFYLNQQKDGLQGWSVASELQPEVINLNDSILKYSDGMEYFMPYGVYDPKWLKGRTVMDENHQLTWNPYKISLRW